jgi:hypothetical protein
VRTKVNPSVAPEALVATNASLVVSEETPVLRRLRGSMRNGDVEDHRRHLAEKYKLGET